MKNSNQPIGKKATTVLKEGSNHSFGNNKEVVFLGVSQTYVGAGKNSQDYHLYEFVDHNGNIEELENGEFLWLEGENSLYKFTQEQLKMLGWSAFVE